MIVPAYVPGEWIAVVTDGTLAVLPPETAPAVVAELWTAIREGASLTDHLQVLLRTGFTHVPPFALVSLAGGEVHAIVRGQVRVEVVTTAGPRVLSGAHMSTWVEEVLADARSVAVRTGPSADAPDAGAAGYRDALPVLAAVVRVSDVLVDLRSVAVAVAAERTPAVPAWAPGPQAAASLPAGVAPAPPTPAPRATPPAATPPAPTPPAATPVVAQRVHLVRDEAAEPHAPDEDAPLLPVPPSRPVWEPVSAVARPVRPERGYVEAAPVAEPEPVPAPAPSPAPAPAPVPVTVGAGAVGDPGAQGSSDGAPRATEDHDGLTVLSSDVVALRRQLPAWAGDAVPALAVPTPRTPPPAKLLMSSGLTVALNRPVLIGRAPQVTRVQNNDIPRLLTVASPNQDISRTHAEVRMDGEDVIVTDLRSTNGVLLLRQGAGPQRLHPGEPTVVEAGVVVDIGEGVTFIVEAGG